VKSVFLTDGGKRSSYQSIIRTHYEDVNHDELLTHAAAAAAAARPLFSIEHAVHLRQSLVTKI
jgi:hypothetical protein